MKIQYINGKDYRLPGHQNSFQQALYVHLINWKWGHNIPEPGNYRGQEYDAILPATVTKDLPGIYGPVQQILRQHHRKNPFRLHQHFNHMASSQAANVNLFLPVLHHPAANQILKRIKPDFATLATDYLDQGYCLEFWGGNFDPGNPGPGPLGDKSGSHGTDSDIAITYRNFAGELCLWLIEHKLSEKEFTPCSGPISKDRDKARHACTNAFAETLRNKHACYHHDFRKRKYWDITERNRTFFVNHAKHTECPFQGGMNQLWRNLLLALALEQDEEQPFEHAAFSVVKYPANAHLDASLKSFTDLVAGNPKFSVFTSEDVLRAAEALQDHSLDAWARWYRDLYML